MTIPATAHDPLQLDLDAYGRVMDLYSYARFWFDPILVGEENLPTRGRAVFAANHGQFGFDGGFIAEAIFRTTGRPVRALSDRVFFGTPIVRDALWASGIVEGNRTNARRLLEADELIFTMPGGAREALAAEEDRYKLIWPDAAGFARMALQTGAPVIPVASIGSDDFYRQTVSAETNRKNLFGSLVRAVVNEDRYVPPIYAGLGALPLPQQLYFLIGEPIEVESVDDPSEATVAELTAQVKEALEELIARGLELRDEKEGRLTADPRSWVNFALRAVRAPVDVPGYQNAA